MVFLPYICFILFGGVMNILFMNKVNILEPFNGYIGLLNYVKY